MRNKNLAKMLVFILLLVALASFASAIENITYTYTSSTGEIIAINSTENLPQVNVTLPNTTWKLDLINNDSKFKVSISELNHSNHPVLDILARTVDLSAQNYDGEVGDTAAFRYVAKYAYAFNISQLATKSYNITFNYSDIAGISTPVIFKCGFDFTSNSTNTSTCTELSTTAADSLAYATTTGFSSFFLTDDTYTPPPADAGVSGGGGGGGGGGEGQAIIYVTPTPTGASVKVFQGDELVIRYKGKDYHFRVSSVGSWKVQLKSLATYITYDIRLGDMKILGLTSFFSKDIEVSMYVSNRFAMLTFKTIEKPSFTFPLLPPRPSTRATAPAPAIVPTEVYTERPVPAPAAGPEAAGTPLEEIEVPESPIGIWTIIFAIVFVIFLVGGITLYRARLHRLEKPPTVTRTGLEPTGLPETSSKKVSKPAPILKEKTVAEKTKQIKPVKPVKISEAKKLELEKYIFHAFSMGFKEKQVREALTDKGWPEQVIDQVLKEVKSNK